MSLRLVAVGMCMLLSVLSVARADEPVRLIPSLQTYVEQRLAELNQIPRPRRARLDELAAYIRERRAKPEPVRLSFICTHNSRRSQMAQLWAQAAAARFGLSGVQAYSGGTEATAFNPRAVEALRRAGFGVERTTEDANAIYHVRYSDKLPAATCFSKVFDQPPNPTGEFCAIMVCSDADRSCPVVSGAAARVSLPYDDPKRADGTSDEAAAYDERCAQIAREMLYVMLRAADR